MSSVLDGVVGLGGNVQSLVDDGIIERAGTSHATGSSPQVFSHYRILKRDEESIRRVLPFLSFDEQQVVKREMAGGSLPRSLGLSTTQKSKNPLTPSNLPNPYREGIKDVPRFD